MSDTLLTTRTERHPKWKAALDDFLDAGFGYGDLVPHEWFKTALGIRLLGDDEMVKASEAKRMELEYLQGMEKLRQVLLVEHLMLLESEPGTGYRILDPQEQTERAMRRAERGIVRELRKGMMGVAFIDMNALTSEQRRENADARAKLSRIAGFSERRLRKPF